MYEGKRVFEYESEDEFDTNNDYNKDDNGTVVNESENEPVIQTVVQG